MGYLLMVVFLLIFFLFQSNFFFLWGGLEISLFITIRLIFYFKARKSEGVSQIYFLIQRFRGLIILAGISWKFNNYLILIGLFIKLGLFPFFWWFPIVVKGLEWRAIFLISVLGKGFVFYLVRFFFYSLGFIYLCCFVRVMVCILGLFWFSLKLKYLLSWSSIIDTVFIVILSVNYFDAALKYFINYGILFFFICLCMRSYSFFSSNYFVLKFRWVSFIVLTGLPIFTGFIYKIILVSSLLSYKYLFLSNFLLVFSIGIVLFIQRLVYLVVLINKPGYSW